MPTRITRELGTLPCISRTADLAAEFVTLVRSNAALEVFTDAGWSDLVDDKTGNKHTDKIDTAAEKAKDFVEKLDDPK